MPGEFLAPAFAGAAEHEVEEGIERIDLDFEVTFEVAEGIEEDLDDLFLVEGAIAAGDGGPGAGVVALEEEAEVRGSAGEGDAGGLAGGGTGEVIEEIEGDAGFRDGNAREEGELMIDDRRLLIF